MSTVAPGLSAINPLSGDYWPVPILTSEQSFIGCVQGLDIPTAREAVALVELDDIANPRSRRAYQLVRDLLTHNVQPGACAVLAYAQQRELLNGANEVQQFAQLLWDLADHRAVFPESWRFHAMLTVNAAWKRRAADMAARIQQAAAHDDPAVLAHVLTTEQPAVTALQHRAEALNREWNRETGEGPTGDVVTLPGAHVIAVPSQRLPISA